MVLFSVNIYKHKRDEEDALCLAASFFDDRFIDIHGQKRFINLTHNQAITRIRELFNEKEQLQKLRTGLIAQLRQRLSYEFPEIARHTLKISTVRGYTPIIYWLAYGNKNARYEKKYELSIAHDLKINITEFTRAHADTIISLETRITQTLDQIASAIALPEFKDYIAVFDSIGFGLNTKALLLFNLYPLEKFLVAGKPLVEYERSRLGKLQKRDRSLRKFQAFCGLSYSYKQSGDKVKRKFHGSSVIRSHLYIWAVCTLSRKNLKHNDLTQPLRDRYLELRKSVKGKDALTRILFKLTRMLFFKKTDKKD